MFDTDGNGIPDYREPWFWRTVGNVVATVVMLVAPKHTLAWQVSDIYKRAMGGEVKALLVK